MKISHVLISSSTRSARLLSCLLDLVSLASMLLLLSLSHPICRPIVFGSPRVSTTKPKHFGLICKVRCWLPLRNFIKFVNVVRSQIGERIHGRWALGVSAVLAVGSSRGCAKWCAWFQMGRQFWKPCLQNAMRMVCQSQQVQSLASLRHASHLRPILNVEGRRDQCCQPKLDRWHDLCPRVWGVPTVLSCLTSLVMMSNSYVVAVAPRWVIVPGLLSTNLTSMCEDLCSAASCSGRHGGNETSDRLCAT